MFEDRTAMQRHSNWMLRMRRIMKFIGIAMRIDRHHLWMDGEESAPEPHLEDGDIDAYLLSNGYTPERINQGLLKIMDIVHQAKEKHNGGL